MNWTRHWWHQGFSWSLWVHLEIQNGSHVVQGIGVNTGMYELRQRAEQWGVHRRAQVRQVIAEPIRCWFCSYDHMAGGHETQMLDYDNRDPGVPPPWSRIWT